jgi:hypothetical protein
MPAVPIKLISTVCKVVQSRESSIMRILSIFDDVCVMMSIDIWHFIRWDWDYWCLAIAQVIIRT